MGSKKGPTGVVGNPAGGTDKLGNFMCRLKSPVVTRGDDVKEAYVDVKLAIPRAHQEEVTRWLEDHIGCWLVFEGAHQVSAPDPDPNQGKLGLDKEDE